MRAGKLEKRTKRPTVEERINALRAIPTDNRPTLVSALGRYLNDRSSRVRWFALDVVKDHEISELEPHVIEMLSDRSGLIRSIAVECLGFLNEGKGSRAYWLYPMLKDRDWLVRIESIESLAQIGDKLSQPLIAELLKDDVALVRGYAAIHLVMLGGKKYRKIIETAARAEQEEHAQVRFAAALFELGEESQLSPMIAFLSSDAYGVRCATAHILSDSSLSPSQLQDALAAVSYARLNYLHRADQSTMETVEKELKEREAETAE